MRLSIAFLLSVMLACPASIEHALNRMYNFDFNNADKEMDSYVAANPEDPLGHGFRAASILFRELDRLKILEGEFFASNKRVMDKRELRPDATLKQRFLAALDVSRHKAQAALQKNGNDKNALFAMSMAAGLTGDYVALVEKRQLGSLSHGKEAQSYAVKLLKIDPNFADAHLTTGLTEYLLGVAPFFVKWFVRFEEAEGDKSLAVKKLSQAASKGKYLGPFAKIMLAIIDVREKRPQSAELRLIELCRDFPENPLFPKELASLRPKLK